MELAKRPVVLEAKSVHLRDRVNGVSFELHQGEILGLTALEGQGQDELFQVLSGDHRPSTGELLVNGERLNARSPYDAIRQGSGARTGRSPPSPAAPAFGSREPFDTPLQPDRQVVLVGG